MRHGVFERKKLPDRDATRLLLRRRQRAAEQAEREPRRIQASNPEGCLPCGDYTLRRTQWM